MKPTEALSIAPPVPTGIPFLNESVLKTYSEVANITQSYLLSKVASGQVALQILDLLFKNPATDAFSSPALAERLLSELKQQSAASLSPEELGKALSGLGGAAKQEAKQPTRRERHEESKTEERNEKSLETVVSKAEAKQDARSENRTPSAPYPWPRSEEQKHLPLPGRKKMEVFLCPHPHRKHYAKNMCNNCYHRLGRNRKAWECVHSERPHYAKGRC